MRLYEVGGAVRDALLGLPAQDRDWVAVGATPDELLALGYKPVGRDFPVFLHPVTHEEVALARTERKSAPGYHGFTFHAAPEVTLEQDLSRRDLTINAIARDETGQLIDPFGGQRDIHARVLRHVSSAFVEDPVRVLRLARLAARFHDFTVAPETMVLMRSMVAAGEIDALVPERVWQELARGLMEARPSRMFVLLRDCGALARLLPALRVDAPSLRVLDFSAEKHAKLAVRFACLTPAPALRVPSDCRELAEVVARERAAIHSSASLDADDLLSLLERCDALRRPERFDDVLLACECEARGSSGVEANAYAPRTRLRGALQAVLSVDTASSASTATAAGKRGAEIGQAILQARVLALQDWLAQAPAAP